MSQGYPNGTAVCYYGTNAEIGGWNGSDYLIVNRANGGPDVWSSNFTVGMCEATSEPLETSKIKQVLLGAAIVFGVYYILKR